MSTFDDASLVFIPSGYKTSKAYSVKPSDGSGDLTFSRSNDTATRVNSAGLIEKVRTNLILQSNTLNVTWTTPNSSVTGGQPDPDGGNTAWLVTETIDGGSLRQAVTATGSLTFSFILKANTGLPAATLFCTDASQQAAFDLSNGTFSASGAVAKMVSLGNGWYRCSISFTASAASTLILFPSSGPAVGSCFATKAQLEAGDIATDYIATTSAAVSVGPVANVPRLDYLNSSCPRLLLEPQRTNLITFSEQFNNAAWTKTSVSVTANATTSPDGYDNADLFTTNDLSGTVYRAYHNSTGGTDAVNTISGFFKYGNYPYAYITADSSGFGKFAIFNVQTGVITFTSTGYTSTITDYGNGWYRCTLTGTFDSNNNIQFGLSVSATSYAGTSLANGKTMYVWGAQREYNVSYATSYIPTLGAAVTRGADACSKTGISSLIGQTEGTLFIDVVPNDLSGSGRYISIEAAAGVGSGWIGIFASGSDTFRFYGDGWDFNGGIQVRGTRYKVAMAYKNGVLTSAYINGTSVGTLTANTTGKSYANLKLASAAIGNAGCSDFFQSIIFPTALSNAQLSELTA